MPEARHPDHEARFRAAVDALVAPYVNIAPPFMLAKLRELAERYYREDPVAARSLELQEHEHRLRSGTDVRATEGDGDEAAAAGEKV